MSKEKVEKIRIFKENGVIGSNSKGASGGIVIFWNQKTIAGKEIISATNRISVQLEHIKDNFVWVLSNVYAPNTKSRRAKYWKSLAADRLQFADQSWIIMGDFNTPLKDEEKMGGIPLQLDGKQDLMDFINDQALIDMDLQGINFT